MVTVDSKNSSLSTALLPITLLKLKVFIDYQMISESEQKKLKFKTPIIAYIK